MYSVANIIRSVGEIFKIDKVRFLILTHNLEFMSMLIRNKIIKYKYVLRSSGLEELRKELILPYEEHLKDIYDVSKNRKRPSHTTPNSIRHILETINKFSSPHLELQAFFSSVQVFRDCEFIYTLIQDNSHGNIRLQGAYTEESLINGCKTVIRYIEQTFGGQLTGL